MHGGDIKYMVRLQDGTIYGPADVSLLKQWAGERRIALSAMLVPVDGQPELSVREIPELANAIQAAHPTEPAHPPTSPTQVYPLLARRKKRFVFAKHATLPDVCLRCGEHVGDARKKATLVYLTPLAYLGLLGGVLPFLVLALVLRRQAKVQIPVCRKHRRLRLISILLTLVGVLAGIAMIYYSAAVLESAMLALGGVVVILIAMLYCVLAIPIVVPVRITRDYVVVKRCHASVLAELPEIDVSRLP